MTKIKQKYYKRLEQDLYNYKYLKLSIDNIKHDIADYEREDGVGAIDFDRIQISSTNAFSSIVENATISNSEKLDYMEHCLHRVADRIAKIDIAMWELEADERIIVEEKYMNSKQWWQVAIRIRLSERQCRRITSEALRKMAVAIHGITAIE